MSNSNKDGKSNLPWFTPSRSSSLSSPDLAQLVVCLGVGYDGLNSYDGLVDLGLKLSQFFDVQQAQDLRRFVQSRIWEDVYFSFPR